MRLKTPFHKTHGTGSRFQLSSDSWRTLIRQVSLLGLVDRELQLGKFQDMMKAVAFYSVSLTAQGQTFLQVCQLNKLQWG